jgi:dTDP-glucose 4,6-dehydratase
MIISALAGKSLPVYGDGSNVRDWLFVHDLVAGLHTVVEKAEAGGCYNFAGCDEWRNVDTVKALCGHLDRLAPGSKPYSSAMIFVTDRPGHDLRYAMKIDLVQRLFAWSAGTRFADGLLQTVAWYLDNRQWCTDVLARGYEAARIGQGKVNA